MPRTDLGYFHVSIDHLTLADRHLEPFSEREEVRVLLARAPGGDARARQHAQLHMR